MNKNKKFALYKGEEGMLYSVEYRYNSSDSWLKRRWVDLCLWLKRGN